MPAGAQEPAPPEPIPSFAELEAKFARIGEIRIIPEDMFDLNDPRENNAVFRLANKLHFNTRPKVIERILLFKTGDPVSVQLIEESERLLRTNRYLYEVSIKPIAYKDGVVDVEVKARDTWSLDPGISVGRGGGRNTGRISLEEENLAGTGIAIGISYRSDIDRSGTQFNITDSNVFGTRNLVAYSYANYDDGDNQSILLTRPFYALDTRWSAGVSAAANNIVSTLYNSGIAVAEYSARHSSGDIFFGLSRGLLRGWARRYSVGFSYMDSDYEPRPGSAPPERLPADLTLAAPYFRFELIEDAFRTDTNLNLIGRVEDVKMGVEARAQLGRALSSLGSTRDLWIYSAAVSDGFDVTKNSILLANGGISGRYAGRAENLRLSSSARYYHRQGRHIVYYAAVSGDIAHNPDSPGPLQIGGDNGLRGYPLRYQAGEHRALATLEARVYSDWYPLRLFRVGGAVFYDVGRAWHGENTNPTNPGWLSDVGFGLRLVHARTAFGNVLHADIAFPLNREGDIKSVQFVVRSKVAL